MSRAWEECRKVESAGLIPALRLIERFADRGHYVVTDKGDLSELLQKTAGDVIYNRNGDVRSVEIKTEQRNTHGNLFLETWSNRSRFTLGWLYTLQASVLLYQFLEDQQLFVLDFTALREWAFHNRSRGNTCRARLWDFPERRQSAYEQANDTWGVCVPIATLAGEVGLAMFNGHGERLFHHKRESPA